MNKLEQIHLGVKSGDIEISKFKREIKNLMRELVQDSIKTFNTGGSGEFQLLDDVVLKQKIEEL